MAEWSQRDRRGRMRSRPVLEYMEGRQLLSSTAFRSGLTRSQTAQHFIQANGQVGIPEGGITSPIQLNTGADTRLTASGVGVPTPHERARNVFRGQFSGIYESGPGRTSELAATTRWDMAGRWTDILHGKAYAAVATPKPGTGGNAYGFVDLNPRSVSVTGQLLLRIAAAPGDSSLPTPRHFTWVLDPSSSNAYTNATGQGDIYVTYSRKQFHKHGTIVGQMSMVISGTLVRSGLFT